MCACVRALRERQREREREREIIRTIEGHFNMTAINLVQIETK